MLNLFNNQLGFDGYTLAFPSVSSCNAIVYQTRQGLCGLHNFGGEGADQRVARAEAFEAFVRQCNIMHEDHAVNLYSVINKRYNTDTPQTMQLWRDEMLAIAKELDYHGDIYLIALKKHVDKGNMASVYIRYDLNTSKDGCDIRYKRWSKMQETRTPNKPANLYELKKDMKVWNATMGKTLAYAWDAAPTEVVASVDFKPTSTAGLNEVNATNALIQTVHR